MWIMIIILSSSIGGTDGYKEFLTENECNTELNKIIDKSKKTKYGSGGVCIFNK